MRKSDFREDREFSYDCPDDDATLAEKLEYQRRLRKFWESCELPSALPFASPNAPWYCHPYEISPEQQREFQQRQRQRYLKRING
jgi:hypothetical protein